MPRDAFITPSSSLFKLFSEIMESRMSSNGPDTSNDLESTAGSVQSHLSTTNSKQRLRATASCSQNIPIRDQAETLQHREQFSGFTRFLRRTLFPAPILPHPTGNRLLYHHSWTTPCLKWFLATYCLLSLAIFSVTIYMLSCRDRLGILSEEFKYSSNLPQRLRSQFGSSWIDISQT
jgi:hypothetical protein